MLAWQDSRYFFQRKAGQKRRIHRPRTQTGRGQTNTGQFRGRGRQHRPTGHTTKATVSVSIRFRPSADVAAVGPPADQALDCPARQGSHAATDRVAPPSTVMDTCGALRVRRHTPAPLAWLGSGAVTERRDAGEEGGRTIRMAASPGRTAPCHPLPPHRPTHTQTGGAPVNG